MRLAVFSDIHGNLSALEAVLAAIGREAPDETVFAGDLCFVGPRPAACLDRLRDLDCLSLYGNTDEWLLGRQTPPPHLAELALWTKEQLDARQSAWLQNLPFSHVITPSNSGAQDLLLVHANPRDVNQIIFPPEAEQLQRYGRLRQPDQELADLLSGTPAAAVAFGHLHIPFTRAWRAKQLFNISSVSMPGDGDPRAKYAILTWAGAAWSCAHRYVPYDIAPEIAAYRASKPPGWREFADTLSAQGCLPQTV